MFSRWRVIDLPSRGARSAPYTHQGSETYLSLWRFIGLANRRFNDFLPMTMKSKWRRIELDNSDLLGWWLRLRGGGCCKTREGTWTTRARVTPVGGRPLERKLRQIQNAWAMGYGFDQLFDPPPPSKPSNVQIEEGLFLTNLIIKAITTSSVIPKSKTCHWGKYKVKYLTSLIMTISFSGNYLF